VPAAAASFLSRKHRPRRSGIVSFTAKPSPLQQHHPLRSTVVPVAVSSTIVPAAASSPQQQHQRGIGLPKVRNGYRSSVNVTVQAWWGCQLKQPVLVCPSTGNTDVLKRLDIKSKMDIYFFT